MVFSSFRVTQGVISDCWRIPAEGRSTGSWARWGALGRPIRALQTPETNSPTVAYVADATPGMMKMGSILIDSHSEAGGRPQAVDPLRPRARPTVWPGCRYVPGLVAPGSPGSTRSRMSPKATSLAAGLQWSVGVSRSGAPKSVPSSRVRHHRGTPPRERCYPPWASWGVGVLVAPIAEFRPGFSEQYQQPDRNQR